MIRDEEKEKLMSLMKLRIKPGNKHICDDLFATLF